MDSGSPDDLDQRLLHALQLDGRAPYRRLARTLDISEHTAARRYHRLRRLGLRITGRPDPQRLGHTRWLLRLRCTPDTVRPLADSLARRSDTSWVTLTTSGTDLYCAVDAPTADSHNALLLTALPRTPNLVSVTAHCMLHIFKGATTTWHATRYLTPAPASAAASPDPTAPLHLDTTDHTLLTELARDGRATLPALSKAAARSPSSIQRHLDRLRHHGALDFYVDFAPQLLGHHMSAQLWLTVAPAHLSSVGAALATHPAIAFAAAVTGSANLVANGIFRTPADLYTYIDQDLGTLPGIHSIDTAPTLYEVKRLAAPFTPVRARART
ncbi:Lrp/AsnC family transcriptional regulator [Streptomyces paromomycinus]|uniref:Transcriptional regulator n=1 Tax=Streptomyces paromomycinus TaxID=92743 RepID=A0A401VY19_STREY|nr:Lrp/AsnC family transcriptional regulator [Streptomyces paromomycinus]GCD41988.1 transcriptional regulator [Streptomyces paromomycinus]